MINLSQYDLLEIFNHLDSDSILRVANSCHFFKEIISKSAKILNRIILHITGNNYNKFKEQILVMELPIKNIKFSQLRSSNEIQKSMSVLNNFKNSTESLYLEDCKFEDFAVQLANHEISKLKHLSLTNCYVGSSKCANIFLILKSSIKTLTIEKCNENIYNFFKCQVSIEKVTVISRETTWNPFPFSAFNDLIESLPNFKELHFIGAGTASYFDSNDFPNKIEKLVVHSLTNHWYVGINSDRTKFLKLQNNLQDLRIHNLPHDFDGGKVMKFIVEEMKLKTFYYGDMPMIVNGEKQKIKKLSASEVQIQAAFETFKLFRGIDSFKLILNENDIASDAIESEILKIHKFYFDNLKEFEVIDSSGFRRLLGTFLELFKLFSNIKKFIVMSQDRNINILLDECLPEMHYLEELVLDSKAPREIERLRIIKERCPSLKKLVIGKQFKCLADEFFRDSEVEIVEI